MVSEIAALGPQVFLDLKLHDIPNTVRRAATNCARSGAAMFNVHAAGGRAMLEAAVEGAHAAAVQHPVKVLAVTVLTSLAAEGMATVGYDGAPEEVVSRLARLANSCGVDGVVASAREAPAIRRICGPSFLIVTPGIRPGNADKDDQRRVVTPRQALALGADLLVVGRPITRAPSPAEALSDILNEITDRS
jgi:orotidine-5'-phosphate decarboxylase